MPTRVAVDLIWNPLPSVIAESYFATADRASHLLEPMTEAVEVVSNEIETNFEVEGRPARWAALADSTVTARMSQGFSEGPILQRTGTLKSAATSTSAWDIEGSGGDINAFMFDPTGYGYFHVTGTSTPMPQRDYTYISDEALEEIDILFLDWTVQDF